MVSREDQTFIYCSLKQRKISSIATPSISYNFFPVSSELAILLGFSNGSLVTFYTPGYCGVK